MSALASARLSSPSPTVASCRSSGIISHSELAVQLVVPSPLESRGGSRSLGLGLGRLSSCPLVQLSSLAAPSSYSDPLLSALRPLPTDGLPAYVGT